MVYPHGQGGEGLSQFGHVSEKERGQFFQFCVDVFYGRPLTKIRFVISKVVVKICELKMLKISKVVKN